MDNSLLYLIPSGSIGGIPIHATLEELHNDALQVTEHPVQIGAAITDHAFKRPSELILRCGWSNSSSASLQSAVASLFAGGIMSMSDYVSNVYSQLLALQQSRAPFDVTTTKRFYNDMLIVSLQVTTDSKTSNVLMLTATLRQIIIVSTKATTLPAKENQATPASTAEIAKVGIKQPLPASPAPGGAVSPEYM